MKVLNKQRNDYRIRFNGIEVRNIRCFIENYIDDWALNETDIEVKVIKNLLDTFYDLDNHFIASEGDDEDFLV